MTSPPGASPAGSPQRAPQPVAPTLPNGVHPLAPAAAPMQYGAGLSANLPPCALNRDALLELWDRIASGYDDAERARRLRVSIGLPAGELTHRDMAALLDDRAVPLRFGNVKISADPSTDKNLELSFSGLVNTLEVSGADRIWVAGQREQIKEFVGEHKPRYALVFRFTDSKRSMGLGLLGLTGVAGVGAIYSATNGSAAGAGFWSFAMVLYLAITIVVIALPYNRFSCVATRQRRIGDDVVAIGTVIIAVLTLIGVLGIIGDAVNHLWIWLTHLHVRL